MTQTFRDPEELKKVILLFLQQNDLIDQRYQGIKSSVLEQISEGRYVIGEESEHPSYAQGVAALKEDLLRELEIPEHLAEQVWSLAWEYSRQGYGLSAVYRAAAILSWILPDLRPVPVNSIWGHNSRRKEAL